MRPLGPNDTPRKRQARDQRPCLPAKRTRRVGRLVVGLSLAIWPITATADEWSTKGTFALEPAKPPSASWSLPHSIWSNTSAFERATPGFDITRTFVLDLSGGSQLARLLSLIASAEAPHKQYDAVHHGARVSPPAPPTQLTIAQIFRWIEATPGQPHAIGRYQFIPSTLAWLVEVEGVSMEAKLGPALQDRLAARLVQDAG